MSRNHTHDYSDDKLERFGVSMNSNLLKQFDELVERKGYQSRSEAIRDMVRDALVEIDWESENQPVLGTVTIVYDHHAHHVGNVLAELQHSFVGQIVCATHVHLDAHNCLEVVVVKGLSAEIRDIADRLIGAKGVKHGKLVSTTTGETLK